MEVALFLNLLRQLTASFSLCSLKKNYRDRPYYTELLMHEFIENNKEHDIAAFVKKTLELEL